ncbi:MAG: HAD family phosphatase [Lachnospiraceae bacterium]|nr:HAD family phosphatase [Lachnospiraceae bacterium]
MLLKTEAVIFDLDGTLVDSMWMWRKIDDEYLGRVHLEAPPDLQKCVEGMSFHETAVYFKERFSLKDSLEQIKADWNQMALDKYLHEVPIKDGVLNFLKFCKKSNIPLGIATSNSRPLLEAALTAHDIDNYFAICLTGDDKLPGKPAPDIYLNAAKQLGVHPENCLVFEDIIPGILAGKRAGMTVCAVADDYSVCQEEEKRKEADCYIDSFSVFTQEGAI